MTPFTIAAPQPKDRAILLAGALAEASVTNLALATPSGWITLQPRQTDLPSLILDAASRADAELVALDRPIRVVLRSDALLVFTTDPRLADALLRALSPDAPNA